MFESPHPIHLSEGENLEPGGWVLNDRRSDEQRRDTTSYVVARDRFMSGWGKAPHLSYYAIACPSMDIADEVLGRLEQRSEMRNARIVSKLPRIGKGDHLSITWHSAFTYQPKGDE